MICRNCTAGVHNTCKDCTCQHRVEPKTIVHAPVAPQPPKKGKK